ncbi:hypothetical protein COV16_03700 [Candidatus Woesearchaeota archaeon CG10_big_fil_rev_8_21_14_0_10_34_8]|nr:MAG: hypothetical protein COV16_03700 [Candidatus Woesearchaeota archaeon CG10_big_fil_rev_8_21_14_0_10_34_8]
MAKKSAMSHSPLHMKSFALAAGITWALGLFFLAIGVVMFNFGAQWMTLIQSVYLGYDTTPIGILAGMIWGFIDIAIGCVVFVYLYNYLLERE